MDNQHKKIAGYRDLSADEIAMMNIVKALEAKFNRMIDDLRANTTVDQRNVALAATAGEDAFMRAVRSIAQPTRIVGDLAGLTPVEAVIEPGEGMTRYVGTKAVNAKPLTRGDWCALRGWEVPADESPADAGYLVEYADGQRPNVEGFEGYVSWSPADVFERAYR